MFENIVRKLAVTAYGKVGTDWVRMTLARVDGTLMFVAADGSNAPIPVYPTTFRTSGDIVNVVSTLGHRVNLAAVPSVGLPNHTWKTTFSLEGIFEHFNVSTALIAELNATYNDEAIAA